MSLCTFLDVLSTSDENEQLSNPDDSLVPTKAKESCSNRDYHDIEKLLGREWFRTLESLQYLITFILFYLNESNTLYISQTNSFLIGYYNHNSLVYYKIRKLIELGAIFDLDTSPSYVAGWNRAKYYYANRKNLERLRSVYKRACRKKHLKPNAEVFRWNAPQNLKEITEEIVELKPLTNFRGFCSNYRYSTSKHNTGQLLQALIDYYPYYQYYMDVAEELGETAEPDEQIRFSPNIQLSKGSGKQFIKVSTRATCHLCSKTSLKKQKKIAEAHGRSYYVIAGKEYREDYLDKHLGPDRDENDEFDVNASVPRVAHAAYFPEDGMGDLNEDVYQVMFSPYTEHLQHLIPSISCWKDARDYFKPFFMRLYNSSSIEDCVTKLINAEQKLRRKNKDATFEVDLSQIPKPDLIAFFQPLRKAVFDYCGYYGKCSTQVYFEESCIYLEVRKILAERGLRVCQVYDCFYFRHGEKPADMEGIIYEANRRFRERVKQSLEEKNLAKQENIELLVSKIA